MRYLLIVIFVLSTACPAPTVDEPDQCLNAATVLENGIAYECQGPRGCHQEPGFDTVVCDESIVTEGLPCAEPYQLWCSAGTGLLRCEPSVQVYVWRVFAVCGSCLTYPLRCM